jgi:hypothetical protein
VNVGVNGGENFDIVLEPGQILFIYGVPDQESQCFVA